MERSAQSIMFANGYRVFGGTTAEWAAHDDPLYYRELGIEYTDDGRVLMKAGVKTADDSPTPWSQLPYVYGKQGDKGDTGPVGSSPDFEWDGTSIRFKKPDGTWGVWVDLKGPKGDKGDPSEIAGSAYLILDDKAYTDEEVRDAVEALDLPDGTICSVWFGEPDEDGGSGGTVLPTSVQIEEEVHWGRAYLGSDSANLGTVSNKWIPLPLSDIASSFPNASIGTIVPLNSDGKTFTMPRDGIIVATSLMQRTGVNATAGYISTGILLNGAIQQPSTWKMLGAGTGGRVLATGVLPVRKGDTIAAGGYASVPSTINYTGLFFSYLTGELTAKFSGDGGPPGAGIKRGSVDAYHNVTFGGSDGRRAIFWGETEADEAYILCDGGSDGFGGTLPDLRDRMILGASDARPAGTIGGSTEIDLSGLAVGETTLTIQSMPSHPHNYRMIDYNVANGYYQGDPQSANKIGYSSQNTAAAGGSQPHTHALSGTTAQGSNLPPFYSLAFVVYVGESA